MSDDHMAYITKRTPGPVYVAVCSCGWESTPSATTAKAAQDRDRHLWPMDFGALAETLWDQRKDDVLSVIADIGSPSLRIEYAFKAGVQAGRNGELRSALQQIAWLADATEPLSVRAAEIARTALEGS